MTAERDRSDSIEQLIAESYAEGDPTGWFERLYAAAETGGTMIPWDRHAPHRLLVPWARRHALDGHGKRALVVGCGLGEDAEFIASLGYDTTAFDIAESAIRAARLRFPDSAVTYRTADLLDPPTGWRQAFDLVIESQTLQALPRALHPAAIANVARFAGPGGILLVLAAAGAEDSAQAGPPWPLTPSEVASFATDGLEPIDIAAIPDTDNPEIRRWCAEFRRPA